jgi:hypothetical protein
VLGRLLCLKYKGLTPFTLSVWLGYVDMYQHIALKYLSEVLWKYGDAQLQFIDLEQIDSFRMEEYDEDAHELTQIQTLTQTLSQTEGFSLRSSQASSKASIKKEGLDNSKDLLHGLPGWRSAFEIMLQRNLKEFVEDGIFGYLIVSKWSAFGKWIYFVVVVVPYLCVLALFLTATLMRIEELMKLRDFFAEHPAVDKLAYVIHGSDAFKNDSGYIFLILASVGSCIMLYIAWIWLRVRFRHLDQDRNGQVSFEEIRMFLQENLASAGCLASACLFECIVAARYNGQHDVVRI